MQSTEIGLQPLRNWERDFGYCFQNKTFPSEEGEVSAVFFSACALSDTNAQNIIQHRVLREVVSDLSYLAPCNRTDLLKGSRDLWEEVIAEISSERKETIISARDSGWDRKSVASLAKSDLSKLAALDLSGNDLGAPGIRALVKADLSSIRLLDLSNTNLGPEGIMALFRADLCGLSILSLKENGLGICAASSLSEAYLPCLKELDISKNRIGSLEVSILMSSQQIRLLRFLCLQENEIDSEGLEILAESMDASQFSV